MVDSHISSISGPIPQFTHEKVDPISIEIEAILRFHKDIEPKSLQELGFELMVAPSFSHILHEFTRTPRRVYAEMIPLTENRERNRRSQDDDSWMPEGWRKVIKQRPMDKGRFAGYVDKKYYAPGVRRAFRSKTEALRYLEELRNGAGTRSIMHRTFEGHSDRKLKL